MTTFPTYQLVSAPWAPISKTKDNIEAYAHPFALHKSRD